MKRSSKHGKTFHELKQESTDTSNIMGLLPQKVIGGLLPQFIIQMFNVSTLCDFSLLDVCTSHSDEFFTIAFFYFTYNKSSQSAQNCSWKNPKYAYCINYRWQARDDQALSFVCSSMPEKSKPVENCTILKIM